MWFFEGILLLGTVLVPGITGSLVHSSDLRCQEHSINAKCYTASWNLNLCYCLNLEDVMSFK